MHPLLVLLLLLLRRHRLSRWRRGHLLLRERAMAVLLRLELLHGARCHVHGLLLLVLVLLRVDRRHVRNRRRRDRGPVLGLRFVQLAFVAQESAAQALRCLGAVEDAVALLHAAIADAGAHGRLALGQRRWRGVGQFGVAHRRMAQQLGLGRLRQRVEGARDEQVIAQEHAHLVREHRLAPAQAGVGVARLVRDALVHHAQHRHHPPRVRFGLGRILLDGPHEALHRIIHVVEMGEDVAELLSVRLAHGRQELASHLAARHLPEGIEGTIRVDELEGRRLDRVRVGQMRNPPGVHHEGHRQEDVPMPIDQYGDQPVERGECFAAVEALRAGRADVLGLQRLVCCRHIR